MNKAKAGKPGFKKVEYQEITKKEFDSNAVNWVLDQAGNYMTSPEKANANPAINQKGGDMTWFPVYNGSAGCLIAQGDADKAIQSASCTKLDNGNYKLVIKLRPGKQTLSLWQVTMGRCSRRCRKKILIMNWINYQF